MKTKKMPRKTQQNKPKEYKNHTSVSLKKKHVQMLEKHAKEMNISVNDLMVLLLRYINERSFAIVGKRARIKYQNPGEEIQILNLYLEQRDYERNLDARRFGKVSVSWLLAYSIDHFLTIIVQKICKSLIQGRKILNNYVSPQIISIKKNINRIKLVSIWYPQKE